MKKQEFDMILETARRDLDSICDESGSDCRISYIPAVADLLLRSKKVNMYLGKVTIFPTDKREYLCRII